MKKYQVESFGNWKSDEINEWRRQQFGKWAFNINNSIWTVSTT